MDVLDHLNDRPSCGLCGRLVPYSDDFCTTCRRVEDGVPPRDVLAVVAEAETETLLAVAS